MGKEKQKLVKLGRPSFGYFACTHTDKYSDDCDSKALYGLEPTPKGEDHVQFCLAHALEWCHENGVEFPFGKKGGSHV